MSIFSAFKKKYEPEYRPEESTHKVFILKDGKSVELEVPDDDKEAQDDDDND